ncbi:unnamed protein product [Linum tenue]|uniref:Uncharacterized protein n=1 Tax=Linum tenue TaxID=586396 RepID=A0AAV0MW69_9ROSI|nr:unnamed protein product [Linum tenue]
MWLIALATPTFSTAATESPPPMIVVTPLAHALIQLLNTSVPAANFSNSKTPIGPFQITVWVVSKASLNVLIESGPMSSPIQPSGMADAGTICQGKKYFNIISSSINYTLKHGLKAPFIRNKPGC